jgi:CBS domain-containing protein
VVSSIFSYIVPSPGIGFASFAEGSTATLAARSFFLQRPTVRATPKPLLALTAGELMSPDPVHLTEAMPLREAARLLLEKQVGGAPVVDTAGRCVGVLSATDFLRLAVQRADVTKPLSPPLPITCPFQVNHRLRDGAEATCCTLPPGVCPIQVHQKDEQGREVLVCSQPHCVLTDWQVVDVEQLPAEEVRHYMTADPVTVRLETPIRDLARWMLDAHIHRIVVVDEGRRPLGIVSGTDILAAVAYAETEQ